MGIGLWELSRKQGPPKIGSIPIVSTNKNSKWGIHANILCQFDLYLRLHGWRECLPFSIYFKVYRDKRIFMVASFTSRLKRLVFLATIFS